MIQRAFGPKSPGDPHTGRASGRLPKAMVDLPSFRQLEHLVLLADHRHFGNAAKVGHVTQSTLSASIKELENTLQASSNNYAPERSMSYCSHCLAKTAGISRRGCCSATPQ